MANIELRAAERRDIDLLVEFNRAHAQEVEDKGLDTDVLHKGITHLMDEPRDGFYLIAEVSSETPDANIPAGTLMVTTEWSDWRNAHFWWIQSVYVHPQYRRLYVEKENTGAQATYRAHGMDETYYLMFEDDWS